MSIATYQEYLRSDSEFSNLFDENPGGAGSCLLIISSLAVMTLVKTEKVLLFNIGGLY